VTRKVHVEQWKGDGDAPRALRSGACDEAASAAACAIGGGHELSSREVPSLRSNFAWTLGGNVVYAACQWLMLMIIAKLGTREMVGEFSYALAVTAPITVLTNLQLRAVQATDAKDHYSFDVYLRLRIVGVCVALCVVGVLAWYAPGSGGAGVLLAIGSAKAVEALSDVHYGLLQRHERMDVIARSMIAKGCVSVVAFGLGIAVTGSVAGASWGLCAAWAALLLGYDIPRARAQGGVRRHAADVRASWNVAQLAQLTRLALPLGVVIFLLSLNGNMPRYFVEHALGVRELGVFSALSYLVIAATTVVGALGQAATPRLAKLWASGDRHAFLRLTGLLAALGAALGLGSAVIAGAAGRQVLTFLYRPEYAAAHHVFFWTALASTIAFVSSALGYSLTAMRSFRAQAPLSIVVTCVTVGACWALVPPYGLLGAVAGGAIASTVQLVGHAVLMRISIGKTTGEESR